MPLIPYAGKDPNDRGWLTASNAGHGGAREKALAERNAAIVRRFEAGESANKLGAEFDVSAHTIRDIVRTTNKRNRST